MAINTAATRNPELIREIARQFGSQCVVLSIEAKKKYEKQWEAYVDNGRESTGLDVLEWAMRGVELGAGEILLTSVDQEGTRKGFDVDLVRTVASVVSVPVIACGGMGKIEHLVDVVKVGKADAIAMADVLHYSRLSIEQVRKKALDQKLLVRKI